MGNILASDPRIKPILLDSRRTQTIGVTNGSIVNVAGKESVKNTIGGLKISNV